MSKTARPKRALLIGALGVYLVMLVFPFAASILLAPAAGVAFLIAAWPVGLAILVRWFRRGSWWALAVPPAALAFWVATIALGEAVFDWTA